MKSAFLQLLVAAETEDSFYHWRELPQVSFLSRQNICLFAATKDVWQLPPMKSVAFAKLILLSLQLEIASRLQPQK